MSYPGARPRNWNTTRSKVACSAERIATRSVDGEVAAVTRGPVGHAVPSEGLGFNGGVGVMVGVGELPAGDVGVGVDAAGVGAAGGRVVVWAVQPAPASPARASTARMVRVVRMATAFPAARRQWPCSHSMVRGGHDA